MTAEQTTEQTPVERLTAYVLDSTVVYRKGDVVKEEQVGAVDVVTVDAFPALPPGERVVDLHFVTVGFTEGLAALDAGGFYDLVHQASADPGPLGMGLTFETLQSGPSYVTLGAWLGDQTLAFQFMAVGVAHGLWGIVLPGTLGFTGPEADSMAGLGFVLMSGCRLPQPEGATHPKDPRAAARG